MGPSLLHLCARVQSLNAIDPITWERHTSTTPTCRSGLVSRKGCAAAPGFQCCCKERRGRFAALSRHKAAPTEITPVEKSQ
ncbi:hypothetical protein DMX06_25695 [Pseudomonas mosselii]|nr:hypothetical protein DMX06_25695 [Pseudomonas mosselii]